MKPLKQYIPRAIVKVKRRAQNILQKRIADCQNILESAVVWTGNISGKSKAAELDRKLYHDNDENVENEGVVCVLDGNMYHGGLTDRLRGVLTVYREAKKRGCPFHIMWDTPFRLIDYLVPATFDWNLNRGKLSRSRKNSKVIVADDLNDFQSIVRIRSAFHKPKKQIHFYTNADSACGEYASLYRELFKPSGKLQEQVDRHLEKLGSHYWSVTYRFLNVLGDFKDWSKIILDDNEKRELISDSISALNKIIKDAPAGIKILVTSDSGIFLKSIENLDSRIYIVPGDVKNIDLDGVNGAGAWMKTFVDQQLIMNADKVFRMLNPLTYATGFPRFAAEVGGAEFIDYRY